MLELKYQQAADLKISDPDLSWKLVSETVGVSERQLRRVRESDEWREYWSSADKADMIESLRKHAILTGNAAAYKLYFEVTGQIDPQAVEALLGMSDDQALALAGEIHDWFAARSVPEV